MGTQGAGRKRSTNKDRTTAEDDALNLIAREAEARLAAKRAARAEAREIRMKELERQQKELSDEDERMSVGSRGSVRVEDGNYLEKGSRAASALTATTLTSLGGTSSRRGSGETALTLDAETSLREIKEIHELKDQIQDVESKFNQNLKEAKDKLVEVEEKYRKAMVSNAQLDNEKNNLMYQVDTLKDSLMELEEQLSESRREYEDKIKEFEREKHAHTVLQFQFNELKETLKQSEELLNKHGIVLGPDLNINGSVTEAVNSEETSADPACQSIQESPISPTDGNNSMLGNTEDEAKNQQEETDPERNQDMHYDIEKEHYCFQNSSNESKVEDQPIPNNKHLNLISDVKGTDKVDSGTTIEKKVVKAELIEQKVVSHQEQGAPQDTENIASQQTSQDHVEEQTSNIKEVDSSQVIEIGPEQSDSAAKEATLAKEGKSDESMVAASKIEDLETLDGDSEGVSSKSQATLVGGKKKKRKKRGKKKGPTAEDKNEQTSQEKVIAKQDSKSGDSGSMAQANNGLLTDHHSYNIIDNAQMNLVEASKDNSSEIVKEAEPVSNIDNDTETDILMDNSEKVELKNTVAVNATLETGSETAIDSTCTEELESTDLAISKKRHSLDNTRQEVQSESEHVRNGLNVDQIDASDKAKNVVVLKSGDNTVEDGQPSSDIAAISETDDNIDDVQYLDPCGVESECVFSTSNAVIQLSSSEFTAQNKDIEESLEVNCEEKVLGNEETCNPVAESLILNNNECLKLQNVDSNEEPNAYDAKIIQAIETDKEMEKGANDIDFIEEGKDVEIMATNVDNELKGSQPEASRVVEVSTDCRNDNKTVEALESGQLEQTEEVSTDLMQEDLSKDQQTDDIPVPNQNNENGKELGVVDTGTESTVQRDSESVTEKLNNCSNENKEVGGALTSGEVGTDVLVEDNSKHQSVNSEPQMLSQNKDNNQEEAEALVEVEDASKDKADNNEMPAQNQIENGNGNEVSRIKSSGQSPCQDVELPGPGMDEEEAQPLVDIEVLVEDTSKDQADNIEIHVQNQIENGHKELNTGDSKTESACQCIEQPGASTEGEIKPLCEIGFEVLEEDCNSKDQTIYSETSVQNQIENGTQQMDFLDTGSQIEFELTKDGTEVKAEIGVEGSEVEGNLKDQSMESESQNVQNQDINDVNKHLEDPGEELQNLSQNDSNIEASHVVESEVEAKQCYSVGPAGEEDEDEGEGMSFDFDDLEMEAAIALSSEFTTAEEEVELGVEVLADEGHLKDGLIDSQQVESRDDDACKELIKVDKVAEFAAQNDSDSLDGASLAEQSEPSQEQIVAFSEHAQIVQDAVQDSSENKQYSPKIHSKDLAGEISKQETGANSGTARPGKDTKRSGKKGKGKGKEECKMT